MSELKRTGYFVGVAVILSLLAFVLSPGRITPEAFLDQGEAFYPDFTDPNEATTLEVVDFDETTGSARPFKVTFAGGHWSIPSHHDYPADGKDRLAQTAAGVIDVKKDDFRTTNVAEHEACGVIDPMDQSVPGLSGRGSRISLKGAGGQVLAEFIVGKPVPDREGFRFVRIPGQNRVYASRMNLEVSTRFEDWIEADLLQVTAAQIEMLELNNYSINERTYSIEPGERIKLQYVDDEWTTRSLRGGAELDTAVAGTAVLTLEELTIVGVRPKPSGLSATLRQSEGSGEMSQADRMSLQNKGFYLARDDGRFLSNEGDMKVHTTNGLIYTLRFGEILHGSGMAVSAGLTDDNASQAAPSANRYLFVTAQYDDKYFTAPKQPASTEYLDKPDSLRTIFDRECQTQHQEYLSYERKVRKGQDLAQSLNARFAEWYYVISEDSFTKIHLSKADLTLKKES